MIASKVLPHNKQPSTRLAHQALTWPHTRVTVLTGSNHAEVGNRLAVNSHHAPRLLQSLKANPSLISPAPPGPQRPQFCTVLYVGIPSLPLLPGLHLGEPIHPLLWLGTVLLTVFALKK